MYWEKIDKDTFRTKTPGGWLVKIGARDSRGGIKLCYVPDVDYKWEIK